MKPLHHNQTATQLQHVLRSPVGGYIFHGAPGMGKATAASDIARQANCAQVSGGSCSATARCASCKLFAAGSHPDLVIVAPDTGREVITVEQARRIGQVLGMTVFRPGATRFVIIDGADRLTVEAQNVLLKMLEEPPPATRFILTAAQVDALLATVRSRLAHVYFAPVPPAQVAAWLTDTRGVPSAVANTVAILADGAPGVALSLSQDADALTARQELAALAGKALTTNLFGRLLIARQLTEQKLPLAGWAAQLHKQIADGVRSGDDATVAAYRLEALEKLRRGLRAGIAPRVAVERLMVML